MANASRSLQFPQLKVVQRRRLDGSVLIDGGVRNAMQSLLHFKSESGQPIPPGGASFGSIIEQVETGAGLEVADASVIAKQTASAPDGSTPTADQILATSYKKNSKCIIRIERRNGEDDLEKIYFEHFSLQAVSEPEEEKYQVIENFNGEKIYFFGRRPRFWTYNGIVLNAADAIGFPTVGDGPVIRSPQSFADTLVRRFRERFRGTTLVENDERCLITYEDIWVDGLLINLIPSRNAQFPNAVNVSFTLFVLEAGFVGADLESETLEDVVNELNRQAKAADEVLDGVLQPATPRVENIEAAAKESKAAADEVKEELQQKALSEEAALNLVREATSDLSVANAELADAQQNAQEVNLNPASTEKERSEANRLLQEAAANVTTKSANLQQLEQSTGVATEELSEVAARAEAADLKAELVRYTADQASFQYAEYSGLDAYVAEIRASKEDEGGIVRFVDYNEGLSEAVITVEFPKGKPGNRSVKFEEITVMVGGDSE